MRTLPALLLALLAAQQTDFYQVLGVGRRAGIEEIRKAHKKLLRKYHPDHNKDRQRWATDKFTKVTRAFEVLSDPEKRRLYDLGGEEMVLNKEQGREGPGAQGGNFGGGEEFFNMFFGGGMPGGGGGFGFEGFPGGGRHHRQQGQPGGGREQRPKIDFAAEPNIIILEEDTKIDFANLRDAWMVYLYSAETLESPHSQWLLDFAKKYGEHLKVSALNCSKAPRLCGQLAPRQRPELQIRASRDRRVRVELLPHLSKEFVVQQCIDLMEKHTQSLGSEGYLAFARENTGTPVLLVFTQRSTPSLLMLSIASVLQGRVVVAEVRHTDELARRFGARAFPAVGLLQDAGSYGVKWLTESLTKRSILSFVEEHALAAGSQRKPRAPTRLTRTMAEFGTCGPKDSSFCVIFVTQGDVSPEQLDALLPLSAKYANDPVSLYHLAEDELDAQAWRERLGGGRTIVLRGKRGKALTLPTGLADTPQAELERVIDGLLAGNVQGMAGAPALESIFRRG